MNLQHYKGGESVALSEREKLFAAVAVAAVIIAAIVVVLTLDVPIRNVGIIKSIGMDFFVDANATVTLEYINWGELYPGDLAGVTVYGKNTGNLDINMTFVASDWIPLEAEQYLTVDWNYTNATIAPDGVLPVQFTLSVDPNVQGITNFEFLITVTAMEIES